MGAPRTVPTALCASLRAQDYMMALSLQQQQGQGPSVLSDLELARQLQQEEYQQQQQQQQRPPPAPPQVSGSPLCAPLLRPPPVPIPAVCL